MLEAEIRSSRVISPCRDESGDEDLSVLPRHTKVIITGNNRTKSVLVGLQGVVKKAVGLGGWHWLVLKNGVEVKLQRNALSVLEPPTGNEVDDELEFDISCSSSDMAEKDNDFPTCKLQFPEQSKLSYHHTKTWVSTAKSAARVTYRPQSKTHKPRPKVNLERLGPSSLWRYCRCYNLVGPNTNSNPGYSKRQLINVVQRHFLSQKLDEIQVIVGFLDAAKRLNTMSK